MDLKSIAKALAASEPQTRSEGFARMKSYLSLSLLSDQLPKVWKSLFYCNFHTDLWMADKFHTETIEEIASLYSLTSNSFLWFETFLEMMRNEWEGIDPVRIDKFMLLVRHMLRHILKHSVEDPKTWRVLLDGFIEKSIYKAQSLLFHLADIYLEEMPECEFKVKMQLVRPFVSLMKKAKMNHLIEMVYNRVIVRLVEQKDEKLAQWLFAQATSGKSMQSRARDKFYDAYALATGEAIPNREEIGTREGKRNKKKKVQKIGEQVENVPDALQKVMQEFYNPVVEEARELEELKIGKDSLELKHEEDAGIKKKKKKKKAKESVQEVGEKKGVKEEEKLRRVNFNLKMNKTKIFDKKNIVSDSSIEELKKPKKGILKRRSVSQNSGKTTKKLRTK